MKNKYGAQQVKMPLTLAALLVLSLPSAASAQQVPSRAEPGILMKGLGEEKRLPSRAGDEMVMPSEERASKSLSTKKVFVLQSVVLDGSSAFDDGDLEPLYRDMVGQTVSFDDLNMIAQRITRKYREDGYIFSRAVLSPQKVEDGVVHMRAVEGRITDVEVVGEYKDRNGMIQRMTDRIRNAGIANTKDIERYLLLINDLPGITARSFVKPSTVRGGGTLVVSIDQDTFEGSASIDNRGSRPIGPYRGSLVGAFNSLFGMHDRTTLRGIATSDFNELLFGDITHEQQLGAEGTKVKGRFAVTSANPEGNIAAQNIEGDSTLFDLEGTYPLWRGRQLNFNLIGGFNMLNSNTDVLGIEVAKDRVRSVRAGAHLDFTDALEGVTQFDLTVTQGLDILGATDDGVGRSRANGKHSFTKANLTATRIQRLPGLFSLRVAATGQASTDSLLASEEFTVGGGVFGRAYDSGEIAGDTGWAGLAELRYGGPVDHEWLDSYQVYGFADHGKTRRKSPSVGEEKEDSLSSAGVGVRFELDHGIATEFEVDKPLNRDVSSEGDKGTRFFFSVLKRF